MGSCERGVVEGTIRRVERRQYRGEHGAFTGVHLHLLTAEGPCVLILGGRFGYLADGLAEAGGGVVVRAYHLRAGRAAARVEGGREAQALRAGEGSLDQADHTLTSWQEGEPNGHEQAALPRFLTTAESLVVLEPDWLIDVTSLNGTDYCLRQWLANRLAAGPETLQKLRGTLVHTLFRTLCQDGAVDEGTVREGSARMALDLALLGGDTDTLLEAVAPHIERLQEWRGMFAAEVFAESADQPCYETTLLCPELGLRGRVDLALRRTGPDGPPLVARIVELKTAKFKQEWPDPEFQVRGYYAILASQRRLAPDFKAQVIYTGSAAVTFRTIPCGPENIREVLVRRNQAVLALLLGHAPPSGGNRCRRSADRADCVALSGLLGLTHCHGRDLADAASDEQGDGSDASFYAAQYRLLRMEQRATGGALAALWRQTPAARIAAGTAIAATAVGSADRLADGRWRYRLAVSNGSELRAGETVLLSDGDPVRGEVAVGTLLQVGAETVEVAALEAVGNLRLIDRYDNGEALDRTVRALHAWLRAPAATRALLYGERLPEVMTRAEVASRPATGNARGAAPGAGEAGEEPIVDLSASREIAAEDGIASRADCGAHTKNVCMANGVVSVGAAGARANGHGQVPALDAHGGPIIAARAAIATIDRHIDPLEQAPSTAANERATIATMVAGGNQVEGGGLAGSQRPLPDATAGEADLNPRQAHALDLALRTSGYLLVQGPPGTGKTHLIARMVRALVARGERVLLSAWTNQALDTMLHALLAQGYRDFARLGSTRTLDPLLLPYALLPSLLSLPAGEANAGREAPTPGALAERMRTAPVLAGTVSMLSDPRIAATTLGRDVLILDEAAQLGLAASVGALRLAGRFILVGDDQQLPPVVQSEDAAREGLARSPFAELRATAEAAGALVALTEQYRMHAAIAAWPSAAFYGGLLTPHSSVAARLLPGLPPGSPANPVTDPAVPLALIDAGSPGLTRGRACGPRRAGAGAVRRARDADRGGGTVPGQGSGGAAAGGGGRALGGLCGGHRGPLPGRPARGDGGLPGAGRDWAARPRLRGRSPAAQRGLHAGPIQAAGSGGPGAGRRPAHPGRLPGALPGAGRADRAGVPHPYSIIACSS